ncbi:MULTISPECIES: CHASE3 domain-containing protein [unclassified Polaromonas]|uniref:CHASE3 domain-containing protein n=1 Tax=unclassified Polaromonas TaxID=2638319 RepID=UPI0018CB67C8|nr:MULTISPECIES: CHASE3 domain-containing protein [unclassified Polaromonas]MBG6071292.1 PAS domain S-box-containing protein [Polaromonas sp. CG_9.7]MBG6113292.1 PAS domain S-box-containing protein [Polaromonas sp. CG_9.2]MDH6183253.1 PAS domain S-box-containing protein [Polaromonas sp. CG_23.6]
MTAPLDSQAGDALGQRPGMASGLGAGAAQDHKKRRLVDALIVFVLACLVGVGWLSYRNMHAMTETAQWEAHTHVVIQKLSDLMSSLKDAETGQRGFLITGKAAYLEPYRASLQTSPAVLADLRRLTSDNPDQQRRLAALAPLVAAKLAELKDSIALRETKGFTAATEAVLMASGKRLMDQIRRLVVEAQAQEAQLLESRVAAKQENARRTTQSVLLGGSLGSLALLLMFMVLRWELTSRRRAETARQTSEERYHHLFNSIDEGFCIIDMLFDVHRKPIDYRFLEVNPAFERQTGLRDAVGKRVRQFLPDLEVHWFETYGKVALTGESNRFSNQAKGLDDRWFDVYAFRFGGPGSSRVAVLFSDITERLRAQEEVLRLNASLEERVQQRTAELLRAESALRQAQKLEALGQLTGGVAHDFNNLLAVISASVELLRLDKLPGARRSHYLDQIFDTVGRAVKLTSQLLSFARRQPLNPEVFDVDQQVQSTINLVRPLMGSQVQIDLEPCGENSCFVEADISQFETALVNLAVNARDAMNAKGQFSIRVQRVDNVPAGPGRDHRSGDFVAISVADTGCGIAAEKLEAIFEPFYTTKEVGKGTGLGLSQVFGFTKQSGGEVDVKSELGGGSVFTLFLARAERPRSSETEPLAKPEVEGHGMHVLVVEDNEVLGQMTCRILNTLAYHTTWAANAAAALVLLTEDASRFDLVFSDVLMPGMSGIEFGELVRQRYPGLPVVLTSGYNAAMAEYGTNGFELIQKPYVSDTLVRVFRKTMADPMAAGHKAP